LYDNVVLLQFPLLFNSASSTFSLLFLKLGAAAVNLVCGDQPADVYSGIAAR